MSMTAASISRARPMAAAATARTWVTLPGAGSSSGENRAWTLSMMTSTGPISRACSTASAISVAASRYRSSRRQSSRSARRRICSGLSSPLT